MTITQTGQTQSVAPLTSNQSSHSKTRTGRSNTTDNVQISNAAKTAMQEATETPEQTAKEARSGDRQAQRLLAQEAATAKTMEG
jgi:hypothetical protein